MSIPMVFLDRYRSRVGSYLPSVPIGGWGDRGSPLSIERAIRPGVLWRKGSFGTQSTHGSRFVEAMMTVVATLKQQHRNVLAYMTDVCQAAYLGAPAPSLLPCHSEAEEDLPVAA